MLGGKWKPKWKNQATKSRPKVSTGLLRQEGQTLLNKIVVSCWVSSVPASHHKCPDATKRKGHGKSVTQLGQCPSQTRREQGGNKELQREAMIRSEHP